MTSPGHVRVFSDASALGAALADVFVSAGTEALAQRGTYHVALAGGETPRAAYELLAREPRRSQLNWGAVYIYFGDERCVPPTNEQSNYGMAEKAFLGSVPIPGQNVHRMAGEMDPGHAANEYGSALRHDLGDPPHLDLVMLGLGSDGHTASLFPGTPPDTDDFALVRAVYSQSNAMWRLTVTPKLINAARLVVFGVQGAEKAPALARVLEGERDATKTPAQAVRPLLRPAEWYVDEAAASLLISTPH